MTPADDYLSLLTILEALEDVFGGKAGYLHHFKQASSLPIDSRGIQFHCSGTAVSLGSEPTLLHTHTSGCTAGLAYHEKGSHRDWGVSNLCFEDLLPY